MNLALRPLAYALGGFRYGIGLCPWCNSDAPLLYDCPVCEYKTVPRERQWERFKRQVSSEAPEKEGE